MPNYLSNLNIMQIFFKVTSDICILYTNIYRTSARRQLCLAYIRYILDIGTLHIHIPILNLHNDIVTQLI